jgi:hypothetical protein
MFHRRRTWLLVLALLAALAVAVLLIITLGPAPAPVPLPNPNGYDDFLKAGAAASVDVGDYPTLDHEAPRHLVSTNTESLRLLRLGLTRQCLMPTETAMTNMAGMMNDLAGMKRLAQLLAAEGRLHELDDQPVAAAYTYLDAIHFGNEISRGGVLINRLVGVAVEAIGRFPLAKLVPRLTPTEARKVIAELEKIDSAHLTWDEIRRNEGRYARHEMLARPNPIVWGILWWQLQAPIQRATEKHNRIIAQERLLATELALRCYQSDKARAPARLDELVPDYLSRVPQDPFSGKAMVYRPQGTNWLLYSIGQDGVDNGGRAVARGFSSPGDLLYDVP